MCQGRTRTTNTYPHCDYVVGARATVGTRKKERKKERKKDRKKDRKKKRKKDTPAYPGSEGIDGNEFCLMCLHLCLCLCVYVLGDVCVCVCVRVGFEA